MKFKITPFRKVDLEEAQRLSVAVGWPHTTDDWCFAVALGKGYCVRNLESGALLGTCFSWQFGEDLATIGKLIVSPEAGGKGLGRALLHACLDDHRDSLILLHATEAAVPLYLSEGYEQTDWVRQVQGDVNFAPGAQGAVSPDWAMKSITPTTHDTMLDMDRTATALDRSRILKAILADGSASGAMLYEQGKPSGYALQRSFGRGVVIGPVIADTVDQAKFLVTHLMSSLVGQFVRLDLQDEMLATPWFETFGLEQVDRVQVMTNGPLPDTVGAIRKFALIGHAFG